MTDLAEKAVDNFKQGFACSQAVLNAFASQFGLSENLALKIASPFGGGMARQGHVCGAVTGALMALGLKFGFDDPSGKAVTYERIASFMQRFKESHGSLICRELIGCDLTTPQGLQEARERGVFQSICPNLVRDATSLVAEMLNEP